MGIDIHGWVEVKSWGDDKWEGVLRIEGFVDRSHPAGSSIFRDVGMFEPVAAYRGFPNDVSEEVKRRNPEGDWGNFGFTWAYWHEIAAIDWEVVHITPPKVFKYNRHSSGDLWLDPYELKDPPPLDFTQEGDVDFEDTRYRVVHYRPVRRDELLHPGWHIIFDAMKFIISQDFRGDEDARLVVWFNG